MVQTNPILEKIIREEAENTHREFLREMHPYFRLETLRPAIIELDPKLEISEAFYTAGKTKSTLLVGSKNPLKYKVKEIKVTTRHGTAHETAHQLHAEHYVKTHHSASIYTRSRMRNRIARELVAELATYLFFRKQGNENDYITVTNRFEYPLNNIILTFFRPFTEGFIEQTLENVSDQRNLTEILKMLELSGIDRQNLLKRFVEEKI